MIVLAALALVVVSVPLVGGRLAAVASIRLHAPWAVWAAMAVQILVINLLDDVVSHTVASIAHVASYGLAGWFVWANRRLSGLWVVALGAALNLAAILANGGVMPASPSAYARAGHVVTPGTFANSSANADAHLWFLGDVFAIPQGYPLANVFSIGDIVLVVGAAVVLHRATGSRLAGARRRRAVAVGPAA